MNDPYIFEIIPSPGTKDTDWASIEKKLELAKSFTKIMHIDVVDGKFAPNTTFMDPKPFAKYAQDFILEVHLMVENPLQYLKPFAAAGFTRFIGHIEQMELVEEFIAEGELLGEVGIAIDTPTDISLIENINLGDLDSILFMTVKAGASGQDFMPDMLEKVKEIKERLIFEQVNLEVDGGINESNIREALKAGANRFVATSAIWNSENPAEAYKKLNDILKKP